VRDTEGEKIKARERNLRWMEALWEASSTTAREEKHKEEVLTVFRELVRESRSERAVREYVPWQPLW
jgi:quinol monooxygenase YgiN